MSEDLEKWVSDHIEELRFVSKYGRTETLQAQAEALLKIGTENGEKSEDTSTDGGEYS